MNKVVLLGRLTKEPEVRYTPSEKVVAQFTLAVDRPYSGQDGKKESDFIPVVLWGKSAELLGNSVGKGHRVLVEGRMQTRSYEAKDGSKRYVTEVVADRFEYIERKGEGSAPSASANNQASKKYTAKQETIADFGESVPFSEEIPF